MSAIDNHLAPARGVSDPLANLANVTPADGTDLSNVTRAIFVGTAGDVAVVTAGGQSVTLALGAGWHPIRLTRILSTGTTAADIIAGW